MKRELMCNDYERHIRWAEYCRMMQDLALDIPTRQSELDLPPADDVRINETAPVMRAAGNGIELVPMNFSFPPSGARGGPVFNFRSEDGTSTPATAASFLRQHSSNSPAKNIRKRSIALP